MSNDTFVLSPGEIYHLDKALVRAGFTPADVCKLRNGKLLSSVLKVIRGKAEIKGISYVIDCDADPLIPVGWTVEEHQKGGQLTFDPSHIQLYLDDGQKDGKYVEGTKLRQRLSDKPVLNANVLDYLLANPDLIPDEWKTDDAGNTRYIFFWGTVYRDRDVYLYVRYLFWRGGRWYWSRSWLGRDWDGVSPAAVRAS